MINYKSTLNLPKTQFPMKANLTITEPITLKRWEKDNIYQIIRKANFGKKKFLLYDGPPYANGPIHIGHGLNKILKDIILKSKSLSGWDTPFIPGWDCHGLPIEHKVEQILSNKINHSTFRDECRKYVLNQIKNQKKDFIRLGILGDWENSYLTMNFKFEANIVRTLGKIISNGYLYQGVKPVHWCCSCSSSLAEAEVEYYEKKSFSIYFTLKSVNNIASKFGTNVLDLPVFLLVWTTTPWTIPANCAIALNKKYNYQLIKIEKKCFIIAEQLVTNVMNEIGIKKWNILGSISGINLENIYFEHPFLKVHVPVIMSNHVNTDSGTGLVHIAPGHGPDDYIIAKKYKLKIINLIDANGIFQNDIFSQANGMNISEVNKLVIYLLNKKSSLIFCNTINHSYPHCWRHRIPIIFRSTSQWFISMEKNSLRLKALKIIDSVNWMPKSGIKRIKSMLLDRPDWCISRQRIWGVPMTLFTHKITGKLHPNTINIIEKAAQKIEEIGIQAWWNLDKKFFLGDEHEEYNKVLDTLDVWFDSGSIHYSIMQTYQDFFQCQHADLCIEGSDQHRGWFMSSLIISAAIQNDKPYKKVLTHGFIVDNNGKKMSKSLMNAINPKDISDKIGADIFRLWIATNDYTSEIMISDKSFKRSIDIYRRIRNTMRFLLANLNNFNPKNNAVEKRFMLSIDKWVISKTKNVQNSIINAYNNYNFHDVIKTLINFCSIDLGSFYLDIIKDRQYTNKTKSLSRFSCQTAIWYISESLVRWIAPIMSFTADEIWQFLPKNKRAKYIFTEGWFDKLFYLEENELMNSDFWNLMRNIRDEINIIIEHARSEKIIKNSLEAEILLYANHDLLTKLKSLGDELKFLFLVSNVKVIKIKKNNQVKSNCSINGLKIILNKSKGSKCSRCWHYVNMNEINKYNICKRCVINVSGIGEKRKFI